MKFVRKLLFLTQMQLYWQNKMLLLRKIWQILENKTVC